MSTLHPYTLRSYVFIFHFAQYDYPNMLNCKVYSDCCSVVHIALLCAHFAAMKKKLENICDFIWRHEKKSVPLQRKLRLAEQTHRGSATGFSYDRSEG